MGSVGSNPSLYQRTTSNFLSCDCHTEITKESGRLTRHLYRGTAGLRCEVQDLVPRHLSNDQHTAAEGTAPCLTRPDCGPWRKHVGTACTVTTLSWALTLPSLKTTPPSERSWSPGDAGDGRSASASGLHSGSCLEAEPMPRRGQDHPLLSSCAPVPRAWPGCCRPGHPRPTPGSAGHFRKGQREPRPCTQEPCETLLFTIVSALCPQEMEPTLKVEIAPTSTEKTDRQQKLLLYSGKI